VFKFSVPILGNPSNDKVENRGKESIALNINIVNCIGMIFLAIVDKN
jgi:hypothetical protein